MEAFGESWNLPVTLLEYFPQVLPRIIDPFLSRVIEHRLREKGVKLVLNARIKEIVGENGKVKGVKTEDGFYEADLVIIATGVRPNSELAQKAGLLVSPVTGGIVVNERLQTSDPNIYAGGDCVEITHLITGRRIVMPLGSLANKQGRVIATNIAGGYAVFKGTIGAFILKCFVISTSLFKSLNPDIVGSVTSMVYFTPVIDAITGHPIPGGPSIKINSEFCFCATFFASFLTVETNFPELSAPENKFA